MAEDGRNSRSVQCCSFSLTSALAKFCDDGTAPSPRIPPLTLDQIANWAQIVEAVILSLSIVFIGAEARQTLQHSRTQFGHGLTDRLYDRYFAISRDPNFSQFLIKDWSAEELQGEEYFRALNLLGADLIDLFDTYDAWQEGLVGRVHVDMRMELIKLGAFLSPVGKETWDLWKSTRDEEFCQWFEAEVYGSAS